MDKILSRRLSAHHAQFYIYDSTERFGETLADWSDEISSRGYFSNGRGVKLCTVAGLWVYWLEVYLSKTAPSLEECQRALAFNLAITSNVLSIFSHVEGIASNMNIDSGDYVLYILAYNLGVDEYSDSDDVSDEELEQMTDIERYKIVLVPGRIENEGVIKGVEYIKATMQLIAEKNSSLFLRF
jgi:hypothetical protein